MPYHRNFTPLLSPLQANDISPNTNIQPFVLTRLETEVIAHILKSYKNMVSYIEDRDYLLQENLVALQRGIVSCELAGGHVGGTEASVMAALHRYL